MRKLILALSAAALVAAPATASAADYKVTGGKLDWTIANYFASGDANRTWLGYATATTGPGAANGFVTAVAPATITGPAGAVTTVDGTSPRLIDSLYTLGFPVNANGTYSDAGVGAVALTGTLNMAVHNIPLTLKDPKITLNGLTGTVTGEGVNLSGPVDHSKVQFNLDLSKSQVVQRADGSKQITGIVPASTADTVMGGFPAGTTRYGTMSLTLAVEYPAPNSGPQGEKGEPGTTTLGSPGTSGPVGPQGPVGPRGPAGKSAKISTFKLAKAPFAGTATRTVRVLQRKTGKVLATGTLKGRTLRVSHLEATKLKGSFVVRLTNGTRRAVITLR